MAESQTKLFVQNNHGLVQSNIVSTNKSESEKTKAQDSIPKQKKNIKYILEAKLEHIQLQQRLLKCEMEIRGAIVPSIVSKTKVRNLKTRDRLAFLKSPSSTNKMQCPTYIKDGLEQIYKEINDIKKIVAAIERSKGKKT